MAEIIQGSEEWFAARRGKVTASRVADVIAKTKTGWGASRGNYLAELVAERLTGQTADSYTNPAMQWGVETEPQARAAYEFYQRCTVEEVGFVDHPRIAMTGASPDGLVGEDGMVEIKCPLTKTHIDTLLGQTIPGKYLTQMQWQMACAGRRWCDFVSFDPRLPESLSLFTQRVDRDDEAIAELEGLVSDFLKEVVEVTAKLEKIGGLVSPIEAG
jgi:putative phage-type endonuclease